MTRPTAFAKPSIVRRTHVVSNVKPSKRNATATMTLSELSKKSATEQCTAYHTYINQIRPMMTIDTSNSFSSDSDLLQDVCQFQSNCRNMILSANSTYSEQLYSFNSQLLEELNWYKAYDC